MSVQRIITIVTLVAVTSLTSVSSFAECSRYTAYLNQACESNRGIAIKSVDAIKNAADIVAKSNVKQAKGAHLEGKVLILS
tara:strand:+ start:1403 stop:1645 length:243 start_codon:yes stop_codon:yes gene_type:complete